MKTLFVAVHGITVWGASFDSDEDAMSNAEQWVEENSGGWDDFHADDYHVEEIDVPDNAAGADFRSCADLSEYQETARKMFEEGE